VKRIIIVLTVVVLLFFTLLLFLGRPGKDRNAPRYVSLTTQPAGPLGGEFIDWGGSIPFAGGKVWIYTAINLTNHHAFLYDLDQRRIFGEIFNAGPMFANRDGTKILCEGFASPVTSFKQRIAAGLNKLWPGKSALIKTNAVESFWLLDTRDNSAKRLGEFHQWPGTGSRWRPAPGFRYGYNVPNNQYEHHSFFLCDLDVGAFDQLELAGELIGWWDDHQIVFKDAGKDFRLFDVVTRKSSMLYSASDIERALQSFKLPIPLAGIAAWTVWNGNEYDFYFMAAGVSRDNGRSFLLKASRSHPQLALFSPNFQFGYLGVFDPGGRYYVYNGESGPSGQGGNGAVILRDLPNGTEQVIVPTNTVMQYALPRFYSNSVIYTRNRVIWRLDIGGTNATRLLTIPDQ
jgi:hypothetical protein